MFQGLATLTSVLEFYVGFYSFNALLTNETMVTICTTFKAIRA